jgi:HEAT repeat protein
MTKRERQGETGMNRRGRQINREAILRKEDKVRGVELAKGLGIKGQKGLLKFCLDKQQKASARGVACLALGFLGYKPAIPVLLELADDVDLAIVNGATRALRMMPSPRAVRPMISLAREATRTEVRNSAIDVLGMLGDKRAEETLVSILGNRAEDESTRCYAAGAMAGLGPPSDVAMACLLDALREPSALVRWTVLNTLGIVGNQNTIPAIKACLADQETVPHLPSKETVASAAENALRNLKVCAQPRS